MSKEDPFSWDKRPHVGTVGKLIELLQKVPPKTPLGLSVYGHNYYASRDRDSHGPMNVALAQFGNGDRIYLLCAGGPLDDSYNLTPVKDAPKPTTK